MTWQCQWGQRDAYIYRPTTGEEVRPVTTCTAEANTLVIDDTGFGLHLCQDHVDYLYGKGIAMDDVTDEWLERG